MESERSQFHNLSPEKLFDAAADGRARLKEKIRAVSEGAISREEWDAWWTDYEKNELDPITEALVRAGQRVSLSSPSAPRET